MKPTSLIVAVVAIVLTAGCDTPWAAAKRQRAGITWEEWKQGIRTKEDKEKRRAQLKAKREAEVESYLSGKGKNYKPEIAAALRDGKTIVRGMTEEEFLFNMPRPESINTTTGAWGRREQWVYENRDEYYYFKNGILDSWQSRRW